MNKPCTPESYWDLLTYEVQEYIQEHPRYCPHVDASKRAEIERLDRLWVDSQSWTAVA